MKRSTKAELARRINAALALLRRHGSRARAASEVAERFGISRPQAYRYVEKARRLDRPLSIPDAKVTLTVKVAQSVVVSLRKRASTTGEALGELVTTALEEFLSRGRGRG